VHPRKSLVVELRFFGGLSLEETAEALHVSIDTVKRDWRFAKLWLLRELNGERGGSSIPNTTQASRPSDKRRRLPRSRRAMRAARAPSEVSEPYVGRRNLSQD
jgi:DeoR/GlpR family transcriptional regulator of sugar metabolism